MNEPVRRTMRLGRGIGLVTVLAGVLVVLLAVAALLWPEARQAAGDPTVLVFDPSGDRNRTAGLYTELKDRLAAVSDRDLKLVVARDLAGYQRELAGAPEFLVVPDGLALKAPAARYLPLVAARRAAPRNLRPAGVLVYREAAGDDPAPWRRHTARTVCGDSLSLVATGALRAGGGPRWPRGLACGPDPYDHAPVLHALRLGVFDYALVRQWDAERFFEAGLLDEQAYGMREVVAPVPDLVVMVARQLPRHVRLRCGEFLLAVGRQDDQEAPAAAGLRRELAGLHLAGFNLLLEPDFELVRKNFAGSWLPGAD